MLNRSLLIGRRSVTFDALKQGDHPQQLWHVHRTGKERCVRPQIALGVRDQNDRNFAPDLTGHLYPVRLRHPLVDQKRIGLKPAKPFQALVARVTNAGFVAVKLQEAGQSIGRIWLVVGNKQTKAGLLWPWSLLSEIRSTSTT
jgi:hypothetical protein